MRLASRLAKPKGRSATQRTRFHTQRGEALPLRALLRIPSALWARMRGRNDSPWFNAEAVGALERIINSETRVLELGAGASTAWLASRARCVTSFENDDGWRAEVYRRLQDAEVTNVELRPFHPRSLASLVSELPDECADIAIVDCTADADRVACVAAAAAKVPPGGYIVLDDSDRRELAGANDALAGWERRCFVGIKPYPLRASETTFYRRPL